MFHAAQRDDLRKDQMDYVTGVKVLQSVVDELQPARWKIPDDFLQYSHFERVVNSLEWNSSPGYPYLLTAPTNRIFFECDENSIPSPLAKQRIWLMVQRQISERKADFIRVFIKPEPISKKKLEKFRYRIISSVSVVDQIIDAMLFKPFNDNLVAHCHETPVKSGWTPLVGGWKEVPRMRVVSTDKSCWDWTVNLWLLDAELQVRENLCDNLTQQWKDLAAWRYSELFVKPIFITSGGLILKQRNPGVMKSGCVNTISSNSIMQLILHHRVAYECSEDLGFVWAMGDDVIQSAQTKEYFEKLSEYCILKEVVPQVEFAGYRYSGYQVDPLYLGKHAFMLLHQDEKYHDETANAYALLYHRSRFRPGMRRICQQLTQDLVSCEQLDLIWDGLI